MIDLQRCVDQARIDVGGGHVLYIAQPGRQRQTGGIAFGLRFDVQIDCAL